VRSTLQWLFIKKDNDQVCHVLGLAEAITDLDGIGSISFRRVTIGSLPDNVLLEIFDFCQRVAYLDSWHVLVHVCKKWRCIVFASPHRLNLRLECNAKTPVKETLDVWPRIFPIVVEEWRPWLPFSGTNIIAALKHHDHVCKITLENISGTLSERLFEAQKPFPVLTNLHLGLYAKSTPAPVLPDAFLGGCAPHLRSLQLSGIPFPALPKLLLSCQ
jgi:F-box-like